MTSAQSQAGYPHSAADMFSLAGRRAVVTGGRRGIGQAIAIGLARAGADIILVARDDRLDETVTGIKDVGRTAEIVVADLADPAAVRAVAARLADGPGTDILVNNAGTIHRDDALDYPEVSWRAVVDVNLTAVWLLSQAVGRTMVGRGHGKIISIASLLSFQGGIRVPAYTASKHGLVGMTQALANEWAAHGLQVNAIAPGYIATDNTADLRADADRSNKILDRIPAGRWGSVDDLVGAAVFLASPASDYVNGHVLAVDGGWLAR